MTTRHYIAYPMAVAVPVMIALIVLAEVHDWSNGALGGALLLVQAITTVVGTLIAPDPLP